MINIGAETLSVLGTLRESSEQLVGDGIKPEGSGWLNGDANSGVFAPYGVLAFTGAQVRDAQALSYSETVRAWQTTWRITYFGASRSQCDLVAGKIRSAVDQVLGTVAGGYKVTGARWTGLGAVLRDDTLNPALWSASDTLILMCDA